MRSDAPISVRLRTGAGLVAGTAVLAAGLPVLTADPATALPPAKASAQSNHGGLSKAEKARMKRHRQVRRSNRMRQSLVRVALNKRGAQYVSGRSGPWSFDCSGFTQYVYRKATGKYLPHYSGAQMSRAKRVSIRHLRPGDLLFYGSRGSQHVSMYIGKGRMIHATNPRTDVRVDRVRTGYWMSHFAGAGRILPS